LRAAEQFNENGDGPAVPPEEALVNGASRQADADPPQPLLPPRRYTRRGCQTNALASPQAWGAAPVSPRQLLVLSRPVARRPPEVMCLPRPVLEDVPVQGQQDGQPHAHGDPAPAALGQHLHGVRGGSGAGEEFRRVRGGSGAGEESCSPSIT